jgi:malonate transporter and related proteins
MFNFYPFILATLPVLFFISIGIFLKRISFLPDTGWHAIERLTYYILFPALLIHSTSHIRYDISEFLPMAAALNIAALIMFALTFFAWTDKSVNGPRFSSILQNNIQFNGFVAMTIAANYSHGKFAPLIAIGVGLLIPTVNILSVWSLLIWGKASQKESPVNSLFMNPLILACLIGFSLNYFDIGLNKHIAGSLDMLGQASMPLALIAVGTGIDFDMMEQSPSSRLFWAFFRGVVYPSLTVFTCYLFGVHNINIILAAILITSAPTATNSYILARQMGGDAPFMASLVGTSTLISVITIPATIFILFNLGLIDAPN